MFSALTIAKNNGSFQRSGQCLDRLIPRVQAVSCLVRLLLSAGTGAEGGSDTQVAELAKRKQLCFLPLHWTFFGLLLSLPFVQ